MQTVKPLVELTPIAKAKLIEAMKERNKENALLKIGVARVGGCACSPEYQYFLSLKDSPDAEDIVEEVDGIKLAADRADADFLRGARLDYVESPEASGFSIDNPNVVEGSCGCGGH